MPSAEDETNSMRYAYHYFFFTQSNVRPSSQKKQL